MQFISKEILMTVIGTLLGGYLLIGKFALSKILKAIEKTWNRLDGIEKALRQNTDVSNTCLFNDLDSMLRKAEITKVWSANMADQWEKMYKRYLDAGDGVDGGASLRKRADAIEINDVKYAENITKYNRFKKEAIENQ